MVQGMEIVIKKDKEKVLSARNNADWCKHSSDATNTCKHIRMFHIQQILSEARFGHCINDLEFAS